jgi:hypothetical protein
MSFASTKHPFSAVKKILSSLRSKLMSNPRAGVPRYPEGYLYVEHGATKCGEDVATFRAHGDEHADFFRKLSVLEVQLWKEKANGGHEFLIIKMHGELGHTTAKTHRQVNLPGRNSSEVSFHAVGTTIPSLDRREALDTIFIEPTFRTYPTSNKIQTLRFIRTPDVDLPTALHLAYVLDSVHRFQPTFDIIKSQCYWYAAAVYRTFKLLFPDAEELKHSAPALEKEDSEHVTPESDTNPGSPSTPGAGKFGYGITVIPDNLNVDKIIANFRTAWQEAPTVGVGTLMLKYEQSSSFNTGDRGCQRRKCSLETGYCIEGPGDRGSQGAACVCRRGWPVRAPIVGAAQFVRAGGARPSAHTSPL